MRMTCPSRQTSVWSRWPKGGGDDGRGVDVDTVRALLLLLVVVTPPSSSCSPAPFSVSQVLSWSSPPIFSSPVHFSQFLSFGAHSPLWAFWFPRQSWPFSQFFCWMLFNAATSYIICEWPLLCFDWYYLTIYVSTYLSTNERRPLVQVQRSGLLPGQETSSQHQRAEAERIKRVAAAIITVECLKTPPPLHITSIHLVLCVYSLQRAMATFSLTR